MSSMANKGESEDVGQRDDEVMGDIRKLSSFVITLCGQNGGHTQVT